MALLYGAMQIAGLVIVAAVIVVNLHTAIINRVLADEPIFVRARWGIKTGLAGLSLVLCGLALTMFGPSAP